MVYNPYAYQAYGTELIVDNNFYGLLLDMGLGKTSTVLTAIDRILYDQMESIKWLVIAPKRVAESVWSDEIEKWDHLNHLTVAKILGTEKQRKQALAQKADIYIINRENVQWLVAQYGGAWPFSGVVVDESSSFKNPQSSRFKALRQILGMVERLIILTGTPTPNGLLDLWSQIYLLDRGQRLGKTITSYRENYFNAASQKGYIVYEYKLKTETKASLLGPDYYEKLIHEKISDICVSMKKEDYLTLPKRIDQTVDIRMSEKLKKQYYEFERDLVLQLEDESQITAMNAAVLTNKLLQFANGAIYKDNKIDYIELHNEKIDALIEDVEAANGQPMLVFYQYKHDLARIRKYLNKYNPLLLDGAGRIYDWNRGEIPLMLAHAASAGHGLNLQEGGHLLEWFGCPWSLELYEQAVARLDRQGQLAAVINRRLAIAGTMDMDVLQALDFKANRQNALMEAVKARFDKYKRTF